LTSEVRALDRELSQIPPEFFLRICHVAAEAACAGDAGVGWSGLFAQKDPPPLTPPRHSLRSRGEGKA
jgi:hypothetical protein